MGAVTSLAKASNKENVMETCGRSGRLLTVLLVVALGLASPGTVALAGHTVGVTEDTIKIGTFGALTGPGYLYGKLIMNGAEVVYNEVNKAGGIHGRKIALIREEDRCDAAAAIAAVKKLIYQHQVFMLHGGGCSNATIAARPEIEKANIPTVIFASVADQVSVPTHPYIFTTALAASTESYAQVEFALKRGAKRIAVISQHDAWGEARYRPLMEALKKKGIAPLADEEITVDANDATPQLLRLQRANPDAVLMVVYPKPAALLLRDAVKFGFKPLFVGQTAIGDPVALQEQVGIPGALANFFTISMVRYTPVDPEMEQWRNLLEKYFPGDRLSVYNMFGIASAKVVVEALQRTGRDLTRERIREVLDNLRDLETGIYPGKITCVPTDHQCHKTPAWIQLVGGAVRVVEITPVQR